MKRVLGILHEELWPGGDLTPLWTAIKVAMDSLVQQTERKVVLVLSQSPDGCTSTKYGESGAQFFKSAWCRVDSQADAKQAVADESMSMWRTLQSAAHRARHGCARP